MKKFLSLVLALVMAMSLVTVSAGAKEFKDMADAEHAYKEAIDVISDLGIVGGVTADTFQPDGKLTRGGATKFVANLMLGPDLAAKLPDGAPFTDVPAGSTFAKYVNYLKSKGVIGGYTPTYYGVKGELSGDSFLKMVLGALGYDASSEGYTGDGWQVNVAIDAINAGLTKGLPADLDTSKVITREIAAQIVLNALEADTVYYDTKGTISIGNVVISNNSEVKPVKAAEDAVDYAGDDTDEVVQLVEKLFPGVTKEEEATDEFGRPATEWFDADAKSIVLAVDAPNKTYTAKTTAATIYTALGLSKSATTVKYFRNGGIETVDERATDAAAPAVAKDNKAEYGSNGATLEVYYDKTANRVDIICVDEYIAKVGTPTGTGSSRKIPLTVLAGTAAPADNLTKTTTSFAKDDIVVFTYSKMTDKTGVKSVELAQAKTGELSKTIGQTITVDGANIQIALETARSHTASGLAFGKNVKAYLNSNGYYLYVELVDDSTKLDKYAYVLAAKTETSEVDWATGKAADPVYKAQLLFVDGTTEIVEVKASAADLVNDFVKYGINAKGQYELTDATTGNITAGAEVAIAKGSINATVNGDDSVLLNNATTFIVKTEKTVGDETETVYTLYVGYKAVPTIEGAKVFSDFVKKSNEAAVAYVYVDTVAKTEGDVEISSGATVDHGDDEKDTIVIAKPSSFTLYSDKNGSWYQVKAVVDGAVKTINLAESAKAALDYSYTVFDEYTIDENGYYVVEDKDMRELDPEKGNYAGTKTETLDADGIEYSDGLLVLGTGNFALADDATIIYSASTGNMEVWTVADLKKDTNDFTWAYTNEDGEVEYLIILKKA